MFWVILTLTLILSVALIVMVLLQPSKGGGITAAFGGIGGSLGSTFGARRTLEALGKGTTWTAILIAALCIVANIFFVPDSSGAADAVVTSGQVAPATGGTVPPLPPPTNNSQPAAPGNAGQGNSSEAPSDNGGQ